VLAPAPLHRRAFARLFRFVWGDDVDPAIRGLLAFSFAETLAFASLWTYMAIWAIDELGASNGQLGVALLLNSIASAVFGYVGGHLSDRLGRKPLMVTGLTFQTALVLGLVLADGVLPGLVLLVAVAAAAGVSIGASQALVPDLVEPARQEEAFAAVRVASNLGVVVGPPVGGFLLWGERWELFFLGLAALGAFALAVALRWVPRRGDFTPESPPGRRSLGVIARDRVFLVFLGSTVLAYVVYVGFEVALPVAAVDSYGLAPSTWGFLIVINAAAVAFLQLRLTKRVARYSPALRLATAIPLMGLPFLLLTMDTSLATIAVVIALFVVGEMLWVPTSQAIVARLAPADVRGAYMGAFSSSFSIGFALGPLVLLQLRAAAGDDAMWLFLAAVSLVAALVGVLAARGAEPGAEPALGGTPVR
jgi:predicted MFS family arabinose efflux permease